MSAVTFEEILQQPAMWEQTAQRVEGSREALDAFLQPILRNDQSRIILTGAGSSAFAGLILAPYLSKALNRRVEAIATTDIVSNPREYLCPDVPTLLVSFARSGNSPESAAATALADQLITDCYHLIVTCAEDGMLAVTHKDCSRSCVILTPPETNDRGFAMTSSLTSMLLATMLAFCPTVPVDALIAGAVEVLQQQGRIKDLADSNFQRIIYLGSGALFGAARESALKTLELTAGDIGAYYDSPLGFRHGPKSLVRDGALVVVFLSEDPYTRQYDCELVEELRGDGAQVIALSLHDDQCAQQDWIFPVSNVADAEGALVFIVFAQLLAAYSSVKRGLNVDNPFPGGEVNRVVKGVEIHPLQ